MIYGFKNPNKLLYHYTRANIAIDDILKSRTLKIGSYTNTNDPKEQKTWKFNLWTNEDRDLDKYKIDELSEILSKELKEKTKIVCFSGDREPLTGDHMIDIFNRGFCKPRMWAQYANNHTGVCLVFEREILGNLISSKFGDLYKIFHGDVTYRDRGIVPRLSEGDYFINIDYLEKVGLKEYAKMHLFRYYRRLFLEKLNDWRDENEFRLILFTNTVEDLFIEFKDSLKGIMFGENTKEKDIDEMMEMTEDLDIDYMGIKWKNCSPWYDFGLKYVKDTTSHGK